MPIHQTFTVLFNAQDEAASVFHTIGGEQFTLYP
jgi:hypothetical protein